MAFPMFGAYHASKFGLEAVGDVFRQELGSWGIRVSVVEPGSIATPIWERGVSEADALVARASQEEQPLREVHRRLREGGAEAAARGIPPEKVAATIEQALTSSRPRTRYLVGLDARGQALLARLLPDRVTDRLVAPLAGPRERGSAGGGEGLALPFDRDQGQPRTRSARDGLGLVERLRRRRPRRRRRAPWASASRASGSDQRRPCSRAPRPPLGDPDRLLGPANAGQRFGASPARQASISPPSRIASR